MLEYGRLPFSCVCLNPYPDFLKGPFCRWDRLSLLHFQLVECDLGSAAVDDVHKATYWPFMNIIVFKTAFGAIGHHEWKSEKLGSLKKTISGYVGCDARFHKDMVKGVWNVFHANLLSRLIDKVTKPILHPAGPVMELEHLPLTWSSPLQPQFHSLTSNNPARAKYHPDKKDCHRSAQLKCTWTTQCLASHLEASFSPFILFASLTEW